MGRNEPMNVAGYFLQRDTHDRLTARRQLKFGRLDLMVNFEYPLARAVTGRPTRVG